MLKHAIYLCVLLVMFTRICNGMQPSDKMSDEAFNALRSEILTLRQESPLSAIERLEHILEHQNQTFTLRQTLRLSYAKALFQIISNLPDDAYETLVKCKSLSIQLGDPSLEYYFYSYSARLFSQLELYDLALDNYREGYEIAIRLNNEKTIKRSENNIGHVLMLLNRFDEAKRYFDIFYQYGLENNIPAYQATALNNLGEVSLAHENFEKAYEQFSQSLALRKNQSSEFNSSWSYNNLGKLFRIRKQYDQAFQYLERAIAIRKKFGDVIETLNSQLELAIVLQALGKHTEAIDLLTVIAKTSIELNHHSTYYKSQSLLKESYIAIKSFDKALVAADAELMTQKSILQKKAEFSLQHTIATTELKAKEFEVANLKREKGIALEKQKISQKQTQDLLLISFVVAIFTLIFIIYIRDKNRKLSKAIKELATTQKQLLESEKISALTTLVSGMAHQLNTPLGIIVTANSIQQEKLTDLEALITSKQLSLSEMKSFVASSKEAIMLSQQSSKKADELIRQFKLISGELEGSQLQNFKVKSYINMNIGLLSNQTEITFNIAGDDPELQNYPEVFFKVLKQLVNNSIDHKSQSEGEIMINLHIAQKDKRVLIEYTDNGPGIDEELISKVFDPFFTTKGMQSSLGLGLNVAYNSVLHLMKGKLTCHASTSGARFVIELPLFISKET